MRRTIQDLFGDDTWSAWLVSTAQTTAWGLIIALPVALAVVAMYNLGPRKVPARYVGLALAVVVSSMASVAAALVVEAFVTAADSPSATTRPPGP